MNNIVLYSLLFASSSAVSFVAIEQFSPEVKSTKIQQTGVQQTDQVKIEKLATLVKPKNLTQVVVTKSVPKRSSLKVVSADKNVLSEKKPIANNEVSKDLLAKFNKALLATENTEILEPENTDDENAVAVYDLPEQLLARVPNIRYSSHVYSSTAGNRSVRLNDRDLREGSWLTEDIEILEILQNEVIMRVGPQSFSLKALSDWTG